MLDCNTFFDSAHRVLSSVANRTVSETDTALVELEAKLRFAQVRPHALESSR
jgi:hypothetical protein